MQFFQRIKNDENKALCVKQENVSERIKRREIYSICFKLPLEYLPNACIMCRTKKDVKKHLLTFTQCGSKWIVNEVVDDDPCVAVILSSSRKCVLNPRIFTYMCYSEAVSRPWICAIPYIYVTFNFSFRHRAFWLKSFSNRFQKNVWHKKVLVDMTTWKIFRDIFVEINSFQMPSMQRSF